MPKIFLSYILYLHLYIYIYNIYIIYIYRYIIYVLFLYYIYIYNLPVFKSYGLFQIAQSIICHIIGQNNPYWKYRLWLLGWFPVRFCFLERNYAYEMKISVHFIDIYSEPYSAYFLNSMQISFHVAV